MAGERSNDGAVLNHFSAVFACLLCSCAQDHVVEWADTIYSDKDAADYVWGTGIHWYSGDQFDVRVLKRLLTHPARLRVFAQAHPLFAAWHLAGKLRAR